MAHECPECYQLCHCGGDIDDIDFGEDASCTHYERRECSGHREYCTHVPPCFGADADFDECGKCFADGRLNGETSRVECSRCHRMNIASGRMDEMEIRTFTCQRCSDELKR